MMNTRKIVFVIPSLSIGGAERVAVRMANYWSNMGCSISILTFDDGGSKPSYDIDDSIAHCALDIAGVSNGLTEGFLNNLDRVYRLRSVLNRMKPDVVISFMPTANVLTTLSGINTSWSVVVSEQADPSSYPLTRIWDLLRRWVYPLSSAFVGVSRPVLDYFSAPVQMKGTVIHNPVVPDRQEIGTLCSPENREPVICAMGRLEPAKGFDLLLRAFAQIHSHHPDWKLKVWGEGSERKKLEALRAELGLGKQVEFPGFTSKPFDKMKRSAFFVLSSRTEGFPNAPGEALACGLPVIAFDCTTGLSEIIRPGIDGELVPPEDVNALAEEMHVMVKDERQRRQYARRAPEVRNRLGTDAVMEDWNELISDVCRP